MNVLQNKWERAFAEIRFARLAHGAGRRISPESFIISASVIVTGEAKSAGRPKNQERWRKQHPMWPPTRLGDEPAVRRRAENLRRIKRGKIRTEKVVRSLKRRPGRVNDESSKSQKDQQRLRPPSIRPHRFAEGSLRQFGGVRHCALIMTRKAAFKQIHRRAAETRNCLKPKSKRTTVLPS